MTLHSHYTPSCSACIRLDVACGIAPTDCGITDCQARPGCMRHGSCAKFATSGEHVAFCLTCLHPSSCYSRGCAQLPRPEDTHMPAPNPKALQAELDEKAPLDYLEPACDDGEARVLRGGAKKYGRRNYRDTEMLWTTYLGSMRRHLNALSRGEDMDPESGEHHLYHIRANTAVLLGAMEVGTLKDDRHDMVSRVHIDGDHGAKALTAEYSREIDELAQEFAAAACGVGDCDCAQPCPALVNEHNGRRNDHWCGRCEDRRRCTGDCL